MSSSLTNIPNNNGVNNPSEIELTGISLIPRTEGNDDRNETILHTDDTVQQAARAPPPSQDEEGLTGRRRRSEEVPPTTDGLDSTLITAVPLAEEEDHLSNHTPPSGQRDQNYDSNRSNARPLSLVQVLSSPTSLAESTATTSTSTTVVYPSETDNGQGASSQQQQEPSTSRRRSRDIPPPLNLPPTTFSTMFTSADEPPPYSPTHTILPHYFELEPIPVRTYIIKDSTGVPFLYDFWLISTTQSSPSRPQSVLLQERGLSPQHQAELKYSIIRPQHTDRTALPITGATNAYFIPALALVADHYPSRWIWWGTEALQMVVFGRQHKNVIMEWRWKHGRTRIGGPVVHRLIGASFQIAPDRKFCWKIGSGKSTTTAAQGARSRLQQQQRQSRAFGAGSTRPLGQILSTPQGGGSLEGEVGAGGGGGGWFGSFFGRSRQPTRLNTDPAETSSSSTANIALDSVLVHSPATRTFNIPELVTTQENLPLSEQESAIDRAMDGDDEDNDEVGCYHCREESSTGFLGRIVAVYKPGRPANRARDRPASSRKLEIFTEVGERCETVMMLMCIRLDDLFMSLPAQKKGPFVTSRPAVGGSSSGVGVSGSDGTVSRQQQQITTAGVNGNINEASEGGAEGEGGEAEGGLDLGGPNVEGLATSSRSSMSFTKRLIGTRRDWLFRIKWVIAIVLIAVVLVLVLKPKSTTA
ncbi:hypothetical protein BG015_001773 [Linnemannia schmuckeri]|uniref:Uncharacterized protein n=1 Tax=Linnemannia schmuckeri TaxID=64567 RepID=A0A9P5S3R5_9FUNG|nr:hypothetical protein BG015_001773 [Linnemannia schmuckeri]